jgi:hypothetical protein
MRLASTIDVVVLEKGGVALVCDAGGDIPFTLCMHTVCTATTVDYSTASNFGVEACRRFRSRTATCGVSKR